MNIPIPIKGSGSKKPTFQNVFVSNNMTHNVSSKIPNRSDMSPTLLPGDIARSEPKSFIDMGRQPNRKMLSD